MNEEMNRLKVIVKEYDEKVMEGMGEENPSLVQEAIYEALDYIYNGSCVEVIMFICVMGAKIDMRAGEFTTRLGHKFSLPMPFAVSA